MVSDVTFCWLEVHVYALLACLLRWIHSLTVDIFNAITPIEDDQGKIFELEHETRAMTHVQFMKQCTYLPV
jgi:hypothetical protein